MKYLLPLLFLTSCGKKPETPEKPKPIVEIATAKCEKRPYLINTIGHVQAYATVDVRPQVSGEITGYYFKDGATIKQGDLLYSIDERPYAAKLQEAQGLLEQARASLKFNQSRVERYKGLLPEDFVSRLNFDEYVSNASIAMGQVKEYEGSVKEAAVNLEYCTILAPMDGLLGRHLKDPGNIVKANQDETLVTLRQIKPIYAYFTLAEPFFRQIQNYFKQGLDVSISGTADGKTYKGALDFINNEIDTSTGTINLRALFENDTLHLWPGQFVDVSITLYEIENAIVIPEAAVNLDADGSFVYIAKADQTVEKREVALGQSQGTERIICQGVSCGENVVTAGQIGLSPGSSFAVKGAS